MRLKDFDMRINWTPSELLLAAELVYDRNRNSPYGNWKSLDDTAPEVIDLSNFLKNLAISSGLEIPENYRTPDSVARKTQNIADQHPGHIGNVSNGGKGDRPALFRFLEDPVGAKEECLQIWTSLDGDGLEVPTRTAQIERNIESAFEGRMSRVVAIRRERDPRLRRAKLQELAVSENGVSCEICNFNFADMYGARGEGFLEIHHKNPLHVSGEVASNLTDLIGLCSNCHRMIHRGEWVTPDVLRNLLAKQR